MKIKNYRCFSREAPAEICIRDGFTAFVGPNNSGKSSLLRLFYELRNIFAELSGPASGTFRPTGSMAVTRSGHTATLLEDGHVLIAGGGAGPAELYDPVAGTFTKTGTTSERTGQAATILPDGRVLLVGGQDSTGSLATAEIYDPESGTFSPTGSMAEARQLCSATLLPDGRVLIVGGYGTDVIARAETFK